MNIAIVMPLLLVHRSHKNRPGQSRVGLVTNRLLHSTTGWHFHPSTTTTIFVFEKDSGPSNPFVDSSPSHWYRPADNSSTGLLRYMTTFGETDDGASGSPAETIQKPSDHCQAAGGFGKGDPNSHSQDLRLSFRLQKTLILNMRKAASVFPLELDLQKFWSTQEEKVRMVSVWELMDLL